jgi:hypothetical protein
MKSEIRNPKQIQNSKYQGSKLQLVCTSSTCSQPANGFGLSPLNYLVKRAEHGASSECGTHPELAMPDPGY